MSTNLVGNSLLGILHFMSAETLKFSHTLTVYDIEFLRKELEAVSDFPQSLFKNIHYKNSGRFLMTTKRRCMRGCVKKKKFIERKCCNDAMELF